METLHLQIDLLPTGFPEKDARSQNQNIAKCKVMARKVQGVH